MTEVAAVEAVEVMTVMYIKSELVGHVAQK
jgi:hypothetical protein